MDKVEHPNDTTFLPREKFLKHGDAALSDAELLALFLRTGTKEQNVVNLSQSILKEVGGLKGLMAANTNELMQIKGIGISKAVTIKAIHAFCLRYLHEKISQKPILKSTALVKEYLQLTFIPQSDEQIMVLYLNTELSLITTSLHLSNHPSKVVFPARDIVQQALLSQCHAIILAHNHPNNVTTPSPEDISITHQFKKILEGLDIKLLDHFIISQQAVYSMNEHGKL